MSIDMDPDGYDSGRKRKVMVACVTFDTVKVTDPVFHYGCERVHLIHYVKPGSDSASVYSAFYDRVCEILKEKDKGKKDDEKKESI